MTAETIATLVDSGIPLLGGLYGTLLGFRVIGKAAGEDPKYDAWHERFGQHLKWLGPLILIFGVVQLLVGLSR